MTRMPATRPVMPSRRTATPSRTSTAAVAVAPVSSNASAAVAKLLAAERATASKIIGRKDELRGVLLAVVARLNALLLGVPGTAKTEMVELLTAGFCPPDQFYSTMLTKFSKPAEVFGPLDLDQLTKSVYRHATAGYLPSAIVGVLDEVFKGSSAVLNSLLTIANERRFKNGAVWDQCPTRLLVGMSNEYPDDPATLAAFFDRFPVKFRVDYLATDDFRMMLSRPTSTATAAPMTDADFQAIDAAVDAAVISQDVLDTLCNIRELLRAKKVVASDRRWMQCLRLLRASAVVAGRSDVHCSDIRSLACVLWNNDDEIAVVRSVIEANADPFGQQVREIVGEAYAERVALVESSRSSGNSGQPDMVKLAEEAARIIPRLNAVLSKLASVRSDAKTQSEREVVQFAEQSVNSIVQAIVSVSLGQGDLSMLLETTSNDLT